MTISPLTFVRSQRGVTYLMLMFAIVLIGVTTTAAAKQWKAMVQRELEADLLAKGIEIQNALALYSSTRKAGRVTLSEVYPQSLAELTRQPKPFLRKAYADPITHGEWEYLRAPTGGIMGVRSKSRDKPLRRHEFPQAVRHFDGREAYYDWIFQYPNPSMPGLAQSASQLPKGSIGSESGATPVVPNALESSSSMMNGSGLVP